MRRAHAPAVLAAVLVSVFACGDDKTIDPPGVPTCEDTGDCPVVDACENVACAAHETCAVGECTPLLTALTVSAGTLTFDAATTSYTVDAGLSAAELTVTATTVQGATLTVNAVATPSALPSDPITLDLGTTSVAITVTLQAQSVTYELDIVRAIDVQQQAYAKASNAETGDNFGRAVAVSGDTMIVGSDLEASDGSGEDNNDTTGAGAAYVFVRNGTSWSQQAYLKAASVNTRDWCGRSVAIDGDTLVIGCHGDSSGPGENITATGSGAAYVFVRSGTAWTQQAYLKASNAESGDAFGRAVSISGDTVVVGAYTEGGDGSSQQNNDAIQAGAAYVFVRSGTSWAQQAYVKADDAAAGDRFGFAVSVSGESLVVGSYRHDAAAGAAYVFVRDETTWSQQAKLTASNSQANDEFGVSVAIDGETVVVGSSLEDGDGSAPANDDAENAGAAYVFVRSGTIWAQQAYLKASNAASNDRFGQSVAISGETIVVGSYGEASDGSGEGNNDAPGSGAAYVFARNRTSWAQQAYVKASNAEASDEFGQAIAVSGETLVVGAPNEDSNGSAPGNNESADAGAAYVFSL